MRCERRRSVSEKHARGAALTPFQRRLHSFALSVTLCCGRSPESEGSGARMTPSPPQTDSAAPLLRSERVESVAAVFQSLCFAVSCPRLARLSAGCAQRLVWACWPSPWLLSPLCCRCHRTHWHRQPSTHSVVFCRLLTCSSSVSCPLALSWLSLHGEQSFAFVTNATFVVQPAALHARHRLEQYTAGRDRFFFQWWNYLVYDSTSHQQYQCLYQLTHYSSRSRHPGTYFIVGARHQYGNGSDVSAGDIVAVERATLSRHMDIHAQSSVAESLHRYVQTAVDDDTYTVAASFPASLSNTGQPLSFHLTFHRIHGLYAGLDSEASSVNQYCALISNHFAYNSRVSGWWSSHASHNVTFAADSTRYRGYAAGSWGCQLPHTRSHSPITHPWTWLWLVVPAAESEQRPEISFCLGTARMEASDIGLGTVHGGVSVMGVGNELVGAVFAEVYHGRWYQLPLQYAASDGYLSRFNYSVSQWVNRSDVAGSYSVPLIQSYEVLTRQWRLQVTFTSSAAAFFRAPVTVEDISTGQARLFSDFRACDNHVLLKLVHRRWSGQTGQETEVDGQVVFEGEVGINAVEFAYESELSDTVEATQRKIVPSGFLEAVAQLQKKPTR